MTRLAQLSDIATSVRLLPPEGNVSVLSGSCVTRTWESVEGWFDFQEIYDHAVTVTPNGGRFMEIGCFLGRSTVYLAQAIQQSGKDIRVYAVDPWMNYDGREDFESQFLENIHQCGVADIICPMKMSSAEAAQQFQDGLFDMVFIDGDHCLEAVQEDVALWFPKIKPTSGMMAGHDYAFSEEVRQAVHGFFEETTIQPWGNSWYTDHTFWKA